MFYVVKAPILVELNTNESVALFQEHCAGYTNYELSKADADVKTQRTGVKHIVLIDAVAAFEEMQQMGGNFNGKR